jgi:hypothetical protein
VLGSYLDGRTLPPSLYRCVAHSVEKRVTDGNLPVLDAELMDMIDAAAAVEPLVSLHESQRTTD